MTSNPDVPPFIGYVETTVHALRLIHAARQGVIPRITRRLNDSERRTMIKSGAVFVFSVEESGIKRWTGILWFRSMRAPHSDFPLWDGLLWSPSRIVGNFLVSFHGCFNGPSTDVLLSRSIGRSMRGQVVAADTRSLIHKTTHQVVISPGVTLQTSYPIRALPMVNPVMTKVHSNQMVWLKRCARASNHPLPFSDEGRADDNSHDWRLWPSPYLILYLGGHTFRHPQSEFC